MHYTIKLKETDGQMVATCDAVPGFFTYGDDRADVMEAAVDAMVTCLDSRIRRREPIPRGAKRRTRNSITLPMQTCAKIAIYQAMRSQGVTKAKLARRMGKEQKQMDRLLDLFRATPMGQIDDAMAALGLRAIITVEAA